jgi:hypothetical protein
MSDASLQEQSDILVGDYQDKVDATPLVESTPPKTAIFRSVEVPENTTTDLVSHEEKAIYADGFSTLQTLIRSTPDLTTRMFLTSPQFVANMIGLESFATMNEADFSTIYQAFRRADIDFNQNYAVAVQYFEFEDHESRIPQYKVINIPSAEHILRTYQKELGIVLPEQHLTNEEVAQRVIELYDSPDQRISDMTNGLLSGFPLDDVKAYCEMPQIGKTIKPPLQPVQLDERFLQEYPFGEVRLDQVGDARNTFLPDERSEATDSKQLTVFGYGIGWRTTNPPPESTIRHCQKLMQVDQQLGLLNFIDQQRDMIRLEGAKQVITGAIQTSTSNGSLTMSS